MARKQTESTKDDEVKSGWADSMAKILGSNKPKKKKALILSRAKKDFEIRIKKVTSDVSSHLVVNASGGVHNSETPAAFKKPKLESEETVISVKTQRKLEIKQQRKLRAWENINRVKPDPLSPSQKAKERDLVRIGTKGVVQLFNAVNLQQKALKHKLRDVKKSEFKKDRVMNQAKDIFESSMEKSKSLEGETLSDIDIKEEDEDLHEPMPITTGTITFKKKKLGKASTIVARSSKKAKKSKPAWAALHDDYMIASAKLKDWDKGDKEIDD